MPIDEVLLELAQTLGIAIVDIHGIYSDAIAGIALINIILFAVVIIISIIISAGWFKLSDEPEETLIVFGISVIVIGILCAIFGDCIKPYFFSDYYAIRDMLHILK